MKTLNIKLLILPFVIVTTFAQGESWDQFSKQVTSNPLTKNIHLPKSLSEFNQLKGKKIPESPRPIRNAKGIIRIFKHENIQNPDGTNEIKKSVLCEKVTYINVYDFRNSSVENVYLTKELALNCVDGKFNGENFKVWSVDLYSSLSINTYADEDLKDVVDHPVKVGMSILNVSFHLPGSPLVPSFAGTISATTDLNSVSAIHLVNPEINEECSTPGEPVPVPEDPNINQSSKQSVKNNESCKIKDFDLYYTAIVHVQDDQQ